MLKLQRSKNISNEREIIELEEKYKIEICLKGEKSYENPKQQICYCRLHIGMASLYFGFSGGKQGIPFVSLTTTAAAAAAAAATDPLKSDFFLNI